MKMNILYIVLYYMYMLCLFCFQASKVKELHIKVFFSTSNSSTRVKNKVFFCVYAKLCKSYYNSGNLTIRLLKNFYK